MPYTVLRLPSVRRTVAEELTKRERRAYDAAVDALKGEGCRAGGKRLVAVDDADFPMCQRALYGPWRMITVYRQDESILIIAVRRHAEENVAAVLADSFPGLSPTGRRRSAQPPCCEDAAVPPTLSDTLEARVIDLYGV